MSQRNYEIVLSPELAITPQEFAQAWNETPETRTLSTIHLSEAKGASFIDPLLIGALLSIPATVASSVLYDLTKDVIHRLQDKKGTQGQTNHKHIHIEQTKKPDGTQIIVIDIEEA